MGRFNRSAWTLALVSARDGASLVAMRLLRRWIGWYLVLCLAGGAAVGFSPVLHHLIEHAGEGPRHSHSHALPTTKAKSGNRDPGLGDGHFNNHLASQAVQGRIAIQPHGHFHWPKLSLDPVRRMVAALFEQDSEASVPEQGSHHDHHSIFQLLAQGSVEHSPESSLVLVAPPCLVLQGPVSREPMFCETWEARFAARAPPLVIG